jgi:hypothetical protein
MGDRVSQLTLGQRVVAYRLRRSPRAKRLRVTVSAEGVQVVVPLRTPETEIQAFLERYRGWIERKWDAVDAVLARHPGPDRLEDGALVPLRGALFPLRVTTARGAGRRITFDHEITVRLPPASPGLDREDEILALLESGLRREARADALELIARHGPPNGLEPKSLRIKGQKRLWGSCSSRGAINLNWRLILAPPEIIEYVVVHELCHLREPHHRPPFWRLVESILPDYEVRWRWLRDNAALLTLRRGG